MIIFQTHVAVPEQTVRQIGEEIKKILVRNLIDDFQLVNKEEDIDRFSKVMDRAINAFAVAQKKSCDGYKLDRETAFTIARYLRNGRKINAIKEFRSKTGTGLAEAHEFIKGFGTSEIGAVEFLEAFV